MVLRLEYRPISRVPLEVEGILPETTRELALDAIRRLPVYLGNSTIPLGEVFRVAGDPADERIEWEGDLSGVHWIGATMGRGEMQIRGPAGRHLGSAMRGGLIEVFGSVGDWAGAEMHGGRIHIHGDAADLVGAAYRGSRRGMTEGVILVDGRVGNEVGHSMRRGLIAAAGSAGDLIGVQMLAGTILVFGPTGIRHGAGMRRGTLGLFSDEPPQLLPSFRLGSTFQPLILSLLERSMRRWGFDLPVPLAGRICNLYHGDFITGGRGEILTCVPAASA